MLTLHTCLWHTIPQEMVLSYRNVSRFRSRHIYSSYYFKMQHWSIHMLKFSILSIGCYLCLTLIIVGAEILINPLWPSDSIWQQRYESTLAQVMACCLMARSHYLNQCWRIISKVQWYSPEGNYTRDTSAITQWNQIKIIYPIFHTNPWGPVG